MLISIQCVKLGKSRGSDRTFVRDYPETLSYSIFFISWLSYQLKRFISRTVYLLNNHVSYTVAIFHNVEPRFSCLLQFLSQIILLEIAPYISKSFRNGATCAITVLYFDFYTKYQTGSEFHCCYGNQWLFRIQWNIYDSPQIFDWVLNTLLEIRMEIYQACFNLIHKRILRMIKVSM